MNEVRNRELGNFPKNTVEAGLNPGSLTPEFMTHLLSYYVLIKYTKSSHTVIIRSRENREGEKVRCGEERSYGTGDVSIAF